MISHVRLLMLLVVLSYQGAVQAQTLTITSVTPNPVCAGSAITISYNLDVSESNHNITDIFNMYLFLNGPDTEDLRIGTTLIDGGNSTLQVSIPSDRNSGVYYVRVIMTSSTLPTVISVNSDNFTINQRPVAPTTEVVNVCQNATPISLATGITSGANLRWYVSAFSGEASTVAPAPATTNPGNNTYYVSQTANGCESDRAAISVVINHLPSVAITGLDDTYCKNAESVTLSGSPAGGNFSVDGTEATVFSPGSLPAGQHTVTYAYTDQVGCSNDASRQITIHPPAGRWLGQADKNWNNTANWSCGLIPTATTDVVIPPTGFMPEIVGSGTVCRDLTLIIGASLTISGQLDIKGNIMNRGTLQVSGTIIFSGDTQVIPSGTYSSVSVRGTGIKELAGNVKVTGVLSFSGSYLKLGPYDLLIDNSGTISGFSKNGYVVTDGTGKLKRKGLGSTGQTGFVTFPIGASSSSYTPLLLKNTGTNDVFGVSVISGIYTSYDADENPSGIALTSNNVNKTWLVSEEVQGGSAATLTFQWNEADEQPGFLRNNCFGSHFYNGQWNQSVNASADEADPYSISIADVTNFSPFGIGSVGSALPLKLLAFNASPNGENVSLSWKTTSELNTLGFDIETSSDAVHFSKVGHVAASNNMEEVSTYNFSYVFFKSEGMSYYRLKMLDQDGSFSYSKIISVQNPIASNMNYQVFPNPVTEQHLTINASKVRVGSVMVTISDVSGRRVYETRVDATAVSSQQFRIPLQNLSSGCYYILKIDEMVTGVSECFKFFRK